MSTRIVLRHTRTAFSRQTIVPVIVLPPRRRNHSRSFQPREANYGFYDLSIQQPVSLNSLSNQSPTPAAEAKEEHGRRQDMASRMDQESARTTGAGRPLTLAGTIVFGSRLAGPVAKPAPTLEKIRIVEGIKVPPRPEEPDNCCMSGCVHCVWDIYGEDIEAWQSTRQKAREALKAKKKRIPVWLGGKAAQKEELDPLADIDPGLRAFMELEKRLREKREARQQTADSVNDARRRTSER